MKNLVALAGLVTLTVTGGVITSPRKVGDHGNCSLTMSGPDLKKGSNFEISDVAGSYYFGDGRGVNCTLTLDSDSTFQFKWTGCLGTYDQNSGPFDLQGEMLVTHPTSPMKRRGLVGLAERFYPVRWGSQLYLIADHQMLGFVEKVRGGWKVDNLPGRSGFYYLRFDDKALAQTAEAVKAKPVIPMLYRRYLSKPFLATVKAIEPDSMLQIDKGSEDGLVAGTELRTRDHFLNWFQVEKVSARTATVKYWANDNVKPRVQDKLKPFFL